MRTTRQTVLYASPLRYRGNLFLLVLCMVCWFPLGMLLLAKGAYVSKPPSTFSLVYRGSWFWLCFWGVVFFPVAFLLLLVNGLEILHEEELPHVASVG